MCVQVGTVPAVAHALRRGFMHAQAEGAVDTSFVPEVFIQNTLSALQLACEQQLAPDVSAAARGRKAAQEHGQTGPWLLQFELLPAPRQCAGVASTDGHEEAHLTPEQVTAVSAGVRELCNKLSAHKPDVTSRGGERAVLSILALITQALMSQRGALRLQAIRLLATLALLGPQRRTCLPHKCQQHMLTNPTCHHDHAPQRYRSRSHAPA